MTVEPADPGAPNPYAAPKSRVDDLTAPAEARPAFFAVGLPKLAIMSLFTFGIYEIYWFYQNWRAVQRLTGEKLNAPIRAFFYPLTAYSLFRRIRQQAQRLQVDVTIKAGALAASLFVLTALWRLPDPYWLVSLLGFLPLLSVQSEVGKINRTVAPGADLNSRFRAWNVLAIVIGGLLFILVIVGSFFGESRAA
jgi:hypothetical protein